MTLLLLSRFILFIGSSRRAGKELVENQWSKWLLSRKAFVRQVTFLNFELLFSFYLSQYHCYFVSFKSIYIDVSLFFPKYLICTLSWFRTFDTSIDSYLYLITHCDSLTWYFIPRSCYHIISWGCNFTRKMIVTYS